MNLQNYNYSLLARKFFDHPYVYLILVIYFARFKGKPDVSELFIAEILKDLSAFPCKFGPLFFLNFSSSFYLSIILFL